MSQSVSDVRLLDDMLILLRKFEVEIRSMKRWIDPQVRTDTARMIRALEYQRKDSLRRENRMKDRNETG